MTRSNPVYAIAQLDILDPDAFFKDYVSPLQAINAKYDVEVLAASQDAQVFEGEYSCNFTVILRFPSSEIHDAWYSDPDYQPLITRRRELTNTDVSRFLVIPAFEGAST